MLHTLRGRRYLVLECAEKQVNALVLPQEEPVTGKVFRCMWANELNRLEQRMENNVLAAGALPATGFIRQKQLAAIIPFSRTTLWRKVKDGEFPAPVRLSANVTAWRAEDIWAWLQPIYAEMTPPPLPSRRQSPAVRGIARDKMLAPTQNSGNAGASPQPLPANERLQRELLAEANRWREIETLRAYIAHVGAVMASGGISDAEIGSWLTWAAQVAELLDPTERRMRAVRAAAKKE